MEGGVRVDAWRELVETAASLAAGYAAYTAAGVAELSAWIEALSARAGRAAELAAGVEVFEAGAGSAAVEVLPGCLALLTVEVHGETVTVYASPPLQPLHLVAALAAADMLDMTVYYYSYTAPAAHAVARLAWTRGPGQAAALGIAEAASRLDLVATGAENPATPPPDLLDAPLLPQNHRLYLASYGLSTRPDPPALPIRPPCTGSLPDTWRNARRLPLPAWLEEVLQ